MWRLLARRASPALPRPAVLAARPGATPRSCRSPRACARPPPPPLSPSLPFYQRRTFASGTRPAQGLGGAAPGPAPGPVRPFDGKEPLDPLGGPADADAAAAGPLDADAESPIYTLANEGYDLSWVPYPPTEPAIKLLQTVHETGLPWWAAIAATTVCMRALMVPVAVSAMKNGAKLAAVQPELKRLQERMKSAQTDEAKQAYTNELRGFMLKNNINPLKTMAPIVIQMPLFMTFFFALRRMAEEFPSLETGGAAWFTDLSIADTTMGLPILSATTFLITIELGGEAGEHQAEQQAKMKNVMRALAVCMVPLTMTFPTAVFCYWVTSNSFSCVQTAMFKVPGVKAALGIPTAPVVALGDGGDNSLTKDEMPGSISSGPAFGGMAPTPMPMTGSGSSTSTGGASLASEDSAAAAAGGDTQSAVRRRRRKQRRQNRRKK